MNVGTTLAATAGGNVGVNTATPLIQLQVVGDIRVGTSGTNGCVQSLLARHLSEPVPSTPG